MVESGITDQMRVTDLILHDVSLKPPPGPFHFSLSNGNRLVLLYPTSSYGNVSIHLLIHVDDALLLVKWSFWIL